MKKIILSLVGCIYIVLAQGQLKGDTTGTYHIKDSLQVVTDFDGGNQKWFEYLATQIDRDVTKKNGAPDGHYKVSIQIITNERGKIVYQGALNDPGYGTKEEAMRVVWRSNGRWKPGLRNNLPVKSSKLISITFIKN